MKQIIIVVLLLSYSMTIAQDLQIRDCYKDLDSDIKICIAADSTTYDKIFGFSYRILHVSNPKDSTEIARYEMNINFAVDFAYFINSDFAEEYNLLIIEGVRSFYVYDLCTNYFTEQINVNYDGCNFSDAQGSYIGGFKILEQGKVLQFNIKECGLKQYSIENIKEIKEIKSP